MRHCLVVALLAAVAAGCGGGAASDPFAYDTDQPLAIEQDNAVSASDRVRVEALSYASGEDRVEAYRVTPLGREGRMPAVLFLHGAGGDRDEQLAFARRFVKRGAVALTVTAPSKRKAPPTNAPPEELLRWQRATIVADVVAARRGLELLAEDDHVEPERLGLVGWSMGGRLAAIVADVDERVRATVLMSAGAVPVSEYVAAAPDDLKDDVEEILPAIDPLTHVATIPGAVFVQAGRDDQIVPRRALLALARAAPDDARVAWYDADHALNAEAERDRFDWLAARLAID